MKKFIISLFIIALFPVMASAQLSLNSINTDLHTNYHNITQYQAWVASQGYLTSANLSAYRLVVDSYSTSEVDTLLAAKLDVTTAASTYATITALNLKANSADVYTTAQVDLALSLKLDASLIANYYTKTEADLLLADKADTSSVAAKIERTDYFTATLGGTVKAPGGTPAGALVLCDDNAWRSVASVGGGVTNAVDLNITASNISESLNQQGFNDSVENYIIQNHVYGFEDQTAGTLSYDASTRTFTITGDHIVWINGKRTIKGTDSITHDMVTATHYFYYASDGTLTTAYSSAWGGQFENVAQIAYAYYNATKVTTPVGILFDERHGHIMSTATHANLHLTRGATSPYLFPISAYSLRPASPTDAGNQFAIQGGVLYDEDLSTTIPDFQDGVAPAIFWREGANGDYTWNPSPVVPAITGTTYIKYNQFVTGSWTTTEVSSDNYVNIYTAVTNSTDATYENILFVGQQVYTSLATARAESPLTGYSFGTGVPFNEIIVTNKITLRARSTYTSATGRFRIEAVESLVGINVRLGSAVSANTIPTAGQISYVDANLLGATNVQTAIDTIAVNFPTTTAMNTAIANATASVSVNQTVSVTAGEDLTAGDVVSLINSYGTVTAKKNNLAVNTSPNGAESVFNAASSGYINAAALDSTRFVVAFRDSSTYPKAIIGTINGATIDWGSATAAFENVAAINVKPCKIGTDKILVCYADNTNNKGRMVVLSVSGAVITPNSPADFKASTAGTAYGTVSCAALETDKAIVCYQDANTGNGEACVVSVTGTTPAPGTPEVFEATSGGGINYISVDALSATTAILVYRDGNHSNYGTAQKLTISGTGVTKGTEYYFKEGTVTYTSVAALSSTKAVIVYESGGGNAAVATIGADVTFGTAGTFTDGEYNSITKISSTQFLIASQIAATNNGQSIYGSISGTDIDLDITSTFNNAATTFIGACYVGNSKSIIAFRDVDNSEHGTAVINTYLSSDYSAVRGIATANITSGNSGTILLSGEATGLSSLVTGSQYWLAADYSMSTVPVSLAIMKNSSLQTGEVYLGTAKSATTMYFHPDYK